MKKKVVAMLDLNGDGELNAMDISYVIIRHEWMMVAGLFITIGSLCNVFGFADIDSDAFWAAAGIAAIFEYIHDTKRIKDVEE